LKIKGLRKVAGFSKLGSSNDSNYAICLSLLSAFLGVRTPDPVIKSSTEPRYLRLIFFISAGRKANCDLRKPIFPYNFLMHLARIWHEIESCVSHNFQIAASNIGEARFTYFRFCTGGS